MLRALFLFALLVPAASAQGLEPFMMAGTFGDSLLNPLARFDGESWTQVWYQDVADMGVVRWLPATPDGTYTISTSTVVEGCLGNHHEYYPCLASIGSTGFEGNTTVFSPAPPPMLHFVPADTTTGSAILRARASAEGWSHRLGVTRCRRATLPGESPLVWCHLEGSRSTITGPRDDGEAIEIVAWFSDAAHPAVQYRHDPWGMEGKSISDTRYPILYIEGESTDYIYGDVTGWDENGLYVASFDPEAPPALPAIVLDIY